MAQVKIVGVISTSVLRRGEQVEVERTERIDRLIEKGYVREVGKQDVVQAVSTPAADTQEEPSKPASRRKTSSAKREETTVEAPTGDSTEAAASE